VLSFRLQPTGIRLDFLAVFLNDTFQRAASGKRRRGNRGKLDLFRYHPNGLGWRRPATLRELQKTLADNDW
jgi:hypothetical protein